MDGFGANTRTRTQTESKRLDLSTRMIWIFFGWFFVGFGSRIEKNLTRSGRSKILGTISEDLMKKEGKNKVETRGKQILPCQLVL